MPAYRDFFFSAINLDSSQRLGFHPRLAPRGAFPTLFLARDEPDKNSIDVTKLDFLGVKYVLIPSNYTRYRAWFIDNGFHVDFESPMTVVLENPGVLPRSYFIPISLPTNISDLTLPNSFRQGLRPAAITTYRNASITLEGTADRDGVVVLTDAWHPLWTAKVNGVPRPILRVDAAFRGIPVQRGPYEIELAYQPKTLLLSKLLCASGTIILLFALSLGRRMNRVFATALSGTGRVD